MPGINDALNLNLNHLFERHVHTAARIQQPGRHPPSAARPPHITLIYCHVRYLALRTLLLLYTLGEEAPRIHPQCRHLASRVGCWDNAGLPIGELYTTLLHLHLDSNSAIRIGHCHPLSSATHSHFLEHRDRYTWRRTIHSHRHHPAPSTYFGLSALLHRNETLHPGRDSSGHPEDFTSNKPRYFHYCACARCPIQRSCDECSREMVTFTVPKNRMDSSECGQRVNFVGFLCLNRR